jgi:maltooligosyltrehalose trehalohydrolase
VSVLERGDPGCKLLEIPADAAEPKKCENREEDDGQEDQREHQAEQLCHAPQCTRVRAQREAGRLTTGGRRRMPTIATPPYSVWAPIAQTVALRVNDDEHTLTRADNGWWVSWRVPRHGDRYGYLVNGEGPFPDPRSASQPDGVHQLSEYIDHGRFAWTDRRWQAPPLAAGIIYEMHVGTFAPGATFDAAIGQLPYLVDLGVTHVQVMPITEFPGVRGWGYDGVDLFAPHHAYGGPDGFKRFVDAAHAAGLAVLLDVVYNHLGPSGNYLSRFGPYFTGRYATPWGDAINLDDAGSHEVRRFLCDNAAMWLRDYHVDGLRLDAVHAFVDTSATHFLEQLALEVDVLEATTGRHLVLIAESDLNDPRVVRSRDAHGYGMDAQWSDDFHHALHSVLTRERGGYYADFGGLEHLATAITRSFVYAGGLSGYRGRTHGRAPRDVPGWRFVVAAQNHDQVGNRATGDRLTHLVPTARLKVGAALLLTAPFVPLLFQGEEWAASTPFQYFTSHEDPMLAEQVRQGRRREFAAFGWKPDDVPDPQATETFVRSQLRWEERSSPPHGDVLAWYRALIQLRRSTPALSDGDYQECRVAFDVEQEWIVMIRAHLAIVCNLAAAFRVVPLGKPGREIVLASDPRVQLTGESCRLPADAAAIVRV